MSTASHSGGGTGSLLSKCRRLNGLLKVTVFYWHCQGFQRWFFSFAYIFFPLRRKNSLLEHNKKDIRRLRKSEIYDNLRFKSLLNSGAQRSAVDLGTVTVQKLQIQLAMSNQKTYNESWPAYNIGFGAIRADGSCVSTLVLHGGFCSGGTNFFGL